MKRLVALAVLLGMVLCGGLSLVYAQQAEQEEAAAVMEAEEIQEMPYAEEAFPAVLAVEGVIKEVKPARVLIVTDEAGADTEFNIDEDAFIFVNEDVVEIDKLKAGDKVYITYQEAADKKNADWVEVNR